MNILQPDPQDEARPWTNFQVVARHRLRLRIGKAKVRLPSFTLLSEAHFLDLGPDFYDKRIDTERKKRTHIRQLEALGYRVTIEPAA